MVDAINAATVQQGVGIRVSRNPGGTTISAIRKNTGGNGYDHPWKLIVKWEQNGANIDPRCYVVHGVATALRWRDGSGFDPGGIYAEELVVKFDSSETQLLDNPFATLPVGYATLAENSTTGIWLKVNFDYDTHPRPYYSGTNGEYKSFDDHFASLATIVSSTSYTLPSDADAYSDSIVNKPAMIFLGQVTTLSDRQSTIKQFRRSDVVIGVDSRPYGFISGDGSNTIVAGTDGALYVP